MLFRHVTAAQNAEDTLFCQIDHRIMRGRDLANKRMSYVDLFQVFSFWDTLIKLFFVICQNFILQIYFNFEKIASQF